MGTFVEDARQVLRRAEEELQSLLERAALERNYEELPSVARMAEGLVMLINGGDGRALDGEGGAEARGAARKQKKILGGEGEGESMAEPAELTSRPVDKSQILYPRYSRKGDTLVKTALSGDGTSTYEHRVDKVAMQTIIERIAARLDGDRSVITAERLSDVACEDGRSVPSYQLYLVLGWLKREGILRQHGRKGYSATDPDNLDGDTAEAWSKLAEGT